MTMRLTIDSVSSNRVPPVETPYRGSRATLHESARLVLSDAFVQAAMSGSKVDSCPHDFYKYPARFAPGFAAAAIQEFTSPGETILDPFCGGGTSIVEAVRLGRIAVGHDVSALACFLARAKSTSLSIHDEREILHWAETLSLSDPDVSSAAWTAFDTDEGYYRRNLPNQALEFFSAMIARLHGLKSTRAKRFARLILLAVGQWALDCKKSEASGAMMLARYRSELREKVSVFRKYTREVAGELGIPNRGMDRLRSINHLSSERCGENGQFEQKKAALVITSPPYPGVHMLYHRWQINGRRETPAPFLLAGCKDGDGLSFYCLGNRHEEGLKTYYTRLTAIFSAVRKCIRPDAMIVQMVAFNRPEWQLPAFLAAMNVAGYVEQNVETPALGRDGRIWRPVPGRRWYATLSQHTNAAGNEVVLFHRPKPD